MSTFKTLKVSEHFHSIQGEGMSAGRNAVFWRLTNCVLNCSWCDTTEVWRTGTDFTFSQWYKICDEKRYLHYLDKFIGASLVITGGDPMIQQTNLVALFRYLEEQEVKVSDWFIEVETQATLVPSPEFTEYVTQWNLSPKLANSGEKLDKRIKKKVLEQYVDSKQYQLKFVIGDQKDADEALALAASLNVPSWRVYFMPLASSQDEMKQRALSVAELAVRLGVNYSPRLHIDLWNKKTGV